RRLRKAALSTGGPANKASMIRRSLSTKCRRGTEPPSPAPQEWPVTESATWRAVVEASPPRRTAATLPPDAIAGHQRATAACHSNHRVTTVLLACAAMEEIPWEAGSFPAMVRCHRPSASVYDTAARAERTHPCPPQKSGRLPV